mmetsp:Transcript_107579/g.131259  ORF Transcript_107579/g.131259 Transcript_107579/m.131259 type:complete len:209 (+) Transcript_107579:467-1093(+)
MNVGWLDTNGRSYSSDAGVRLLSHIDDPAIGRGGNGRNLTICRHTSQQRCDPNPQGLSRVNDLLQGFSLAWQESSNAFGLALPFDVCLLLHSDLLPTCRQVRVAVLRGHGGRCEVMVQAVGRHHTVAQAQLDFFLCHSHRIQLHVQSTDGIKKLQESVRATVPPLHRAGQEETEKQANNDLQEGTDTLEPGHVELGRILHQYHNTCCH